MADRTEGDLATRDLPPLAFRASFQPKSVDAEARTAEIVFTTGARVLRGGPWSDPYYEELALEPKCVRMGRLNNGAPLLNSHNGYDLEGVLGVVEPGSASVDGKRGVCVVRFAKADASPDAERVFQMVRDGILSNVSVGYRVHKMEKMEDGDGKVPVMRCIDWEPYEVSVVPMGADDKAGVRAAERLAPNPCRISAAQKQERAMPEPVIPATAAPAPVDTRTAVDNAAQAAAQKRLERVQLEASEAARIAEETRGKERSRQLEIRKLVRLTDLGDELADTYIEQNSTVEDVRVAVLERLAARDAGSPGTQNHIAAGEDKRDKFVRGASAWLLEQTGTMPIVEQAAKKDPSRFKDVSTDGGEFRGMSLIELARESLERNGVRTRGMSKQDLVGAAFTYVRMGGHSYQSTSDFAVLLENVLFKVLLGQYAITPDTWSDFCKAETVADFRPSNRYRLGSISGLDSIDEHGEYKNAVVPDGLKFAITTGTKGKIIALSRQTIINDDMGALTSAATMLGRASRLQIEKDVYALLTANSGLGPTQTDAQAFFHSNRANVNATGSGMTLAGINADFAILAAQKDPSGNEYLDLRPSVLLVPIALRGEATTLNEAQFDPTDSKFQKPNYCRGLFQKVVGTPRLTGTRRYMFADPAVSPAIVVAFLEGQGQAPVLESERGWRVDGVEWKVRLDYKAQMFDPKGAVTNAGQ